MGKLLIENACIINEGKRFSGYIGICGDRISEIGAGSLPEFKREQYENILNAAGRIVMPGVIDTHVHFRDPGLTQKGDFASESRAAVAGGVTSVFDMPNTKPATVDAESLALKVEKARESMLTNYAFYVGATDSNMEYLASLPAETSPGIKLFMGSSTGNMLVSNREALGEVFRLPRIVSVHSESEEIIAANKEQAIKHYGEGNIPISAHNRIRSREACVASTERALELARDANAHLHVLHVSTKDELEMIRRAKQNGMNNVTAEVCASYLYFDEDSIEELGAKVKCNPALKSKADREALLAGLVNRDIDVLATDHAPHQASDKCGDALTAASGIPMIQHFLPIVLELVKEGKLDYESAVELMCHNPAKLFGIKERGYIREGYYADLVIVDQFAPFTVEKSNIAYKCGWSPLEGRRFSHSIWSTFVNGKEKCRRGEIINTTPGKPLEFSRE